MPYIECMLATHVYPALVVQAFVMQIPEWMLEVRVGRLTGSFIIKEMGAAGTLVLIWMWFR